MDDKDLRIFFIKKAMIHEIYYTFYLQVGGETNNIMHTVSAPPVLKYNGFLNSARRSQRCTPCLTSINGIA